MAKKMTDHSGMAAAWRADIGRTYRDRHKPGRRGMSPLKAVHLLIGNVRQIQPKAPRRTRRRRH